MKIVYESKSLDIYFMLGTELGKMAHLHKQLEVIYVKKGKAVAYADKNSYKLEEGNLFITFPNQVHYYETLKSGEYIIILFSPDIIYDFGTLISKSIPENNFFDIKEDAQLEEIIDKIYMADGKYKLLAINGYLNIMMSYLLPKMTLKTVNNDNNTAIHSILDFCMHNFKEDINLDSVAENLHLSKYHISHLINKNLSMNFNEYINSLRINAACNNLRETDMKIADISLDAGFGTIRSFNRSFKQLMGVSPAEYRRRAAALKESF